MGELKIELKITFITENTRNLESGLGSVISWADNFLLDAGCFGGPAAPLLDFQVLVLLSTSGRWPF